MRRILPILILLAAATAGAEPAKSTKPARSEAPSVRLERIMFKTGQALIFDGQEFRVVRRGSRIGSFTVKKIESDHLVVASLKQADSGMSFVWSLGASKPVKPSAVALASPFEILEPYEKSTGVVDPYAAPATSVSAAGISSAQSNDVKPAKAPAKSRKSKTRVATIKPTVVQPKAAPMVESEQRALSRREFDRALADFHSLSKEVQIELAPVGIRLLTVARGSYFHRIGLRSGDVVLSVAGRSIRSVDDAAAAYVDVSAAKRFTVELERKKGRISIHYRFRR